MGEEKQAEERTRHVGIKIGERQASVKYRSKKSDVEDVREVFGAMRTEVPGLVRDLMDTVYSEESAERMAKSVATFYKTLADSGIPKDEVLEMARGWVLDLRNIGGWFRNK